MTDRQVADGESTRITTFFGELVKHLKNENSKGIAIFSSYPRSGLIMYFTPRAFELGQEILEHYKFESCDPPKDDRSLRFLAGDPSVILKVRGK